MLRPSHVAGALRGPGGARMEYVALGDGPIRVVVVPGAQDGLWTVGRYPRQLAWHFRRRRSTQRVLVVSRRDPIPPDYSMEQHAADYIAAVERLGWKPAIWECSSNGGPIGQIAAAQRPDLVTGLILSSTFHHLDGEGRALAEQRVALAGARRWRELYRTMLGDVMVRPGARSPALLHPLALLLPPPRDPERLGRMIQSALEVDNRAFLPRITCPTLVIGGTRDSVAPVEIQREMASLIPRARLALAPGHGHGNEIHNPDYTTEVDRFAREVWALEPAR